MTSASHFRTRTRSIRANFNREANALNYKSTFIMICTIEIRGRKPHTTDDLAY